MIQNKLFRKARQRSGRYRMKNDTTPGIFPELLGMTCVTAGGAVGYEGIHGVRIRDGGTPERRYINVRRTMAPRKSR